MDLDSDGRISPNEFRAALPLLERWGINVTDPDSLWDEFIQADANQGGHILFDEFCHWAILKNLDLDDDDDQQFEAKDSIMPPILPR